MKKYNYLFLLLFLLFPTSVFAEDYCKFISGSGHDLGDEVVCGTEHFYLLENQNNQLKLFAKYNLYTGYIIEQFDIDKPSSDNRTNDQYCSDLANEKGGRLKAKMESGDGKSYYGTDEYCYIEREITGDRVLQNSEAIGAHIDSQGNYLYPQVGDTYLNSKYTDNKYDAASKDTSVTYPDNYFKNYNITFNGATVTGNALTAYKNSLEEMGFTVSNIDLLAVSDMNKIVHDKAGKDFPYAEWGNTLKNLPYIYISSNSIIYTLQSVFGNLKDYIPDEYSWLYSTTYWHKTTYQGYPEVETEGQEVYLFTGSMGKICANGFGFCMFTTNLGCGIRPVVTIAENEIKYGVYVAEEDENLLEVLDSSPPGEPVVLKVKAKEGYRLIELIIKTISGEEIRFTENDIKENNDSTYTISNSSVSMPKESVTVYARWSSSNPATWSSFTIIISIILFVLVGSIFSYISKKSKSN